MKALLNSLNISLTNHENNKQTKRLQHVYYLLDDRYSNTKLLFIQLTITLHTLKTLTIMTTTTQINNAIAEIAKLSGLSNNKAQAIQLGHESYITCENAAVYGGYRLIMVSIKNGSHTGAFGGNGCEPRLKPAMFMGKLKGIIAGLETVK